MAGKSSTTTSHPCCEKKTVGRCIITDLPQQTQPVLCSSRVRSASLLRHRVIRWAVTSVGKKYRKPWLLGTFLQLQGSFFAHRMTRSKNGRPPNPLSFVVLRCSEYEASNFGAPSSDPNNYADTSAPAMGLGQYMSVYVGILFLMVVPSPDSSNSLRLGP